MTPDTEEYIELEPVQESRIKGTLHVKPGYVYVPKTKVTVKPKHGAGHYPKKPPKPPTQIHKEKRHSTIDDLVNKWESGGLQRSPKGRR